MFKFQGSRFKLEADASVMLLSSSLAVPVCTWVDSIRISTAFAVVSTCTVCHNVAYSRFAHMFQQNFEFCLGRDIATNLWFTHQTKGSNKRHERSKYVWQFDLRVCEDATGEPDVFGAPKNETLQRVDVGTTCYFLVSDARRVRTQTEFFPFLFWWVFVDLTRYINDAHTHVIAVVWKQ